MSREKLDKFQGKQFVINVYIVLKRHYPDFNDLLAHIPDHRNRSTYQVAEIIMAGLSMFIFKRRSRNQADCGAGGNFEINHITLFGMRLPIMDTVNDFLRQLPPEELERLKYALIQGLLKRKVLDKWKFMGRHNISIDGTGLFSYDYEPFPGCPYKVSKNGKKSWQVYVVEAKIICGNGLNLSIATEWYQNSEDISEKQDCERKAFVRLAKKIKTLYPRLPIIVTADSLYPNKTSFDICRQYGWSYIFVLKEGSLKTVWEEVGLLYRIEALSNIQDRVLRKEKDGWLIEKSMFINNIEYKGHKLNWIEHEERYDQDNPHGRFVHVTDIHINKKNAWDVSTAGRLRWTIENQGFNTQKKHGYALQHKYSRKHLEAMKNYYNLLQIAHLINQLTEKLIKMKQAIKQAGEIPMITILEDMFADMKKNIIEKTEILHLLDQNKQLRY
jgi:hypothetical protein